MNRRIEKLSPEQLSRIVDIQREARRVASCCEPADRDAAEAALARAYEMAGMDPPRHFVWVDSPAQGRVASLILDRHSEDTERWRETQEALRAILGDATWDALEERVKPLCGKPGGQDFSLLPGQLHSVAKARIGLMVAESARRPATDVFWRSGRRVRDLSRAVSDAVREALSEGKRSYGGWTPLVAPGQFDADESAWYEVWETFGVDLPEARPLVTIGRHAGPWWSFRDVVVISERPRVAQFDRAGRLHRADGPAIEWRDGTGGAFLHGIPMPRWVVDDPGRMSLSYIVDETNAERRRVLIEQFGFDRFVSESGAKLVHEDTYGKLYKRSVAVNETLAILRVENATAEPDGSRKTYWLRVPPQVKTAKGAVAWTFRMHPREYAPIVET